MNTSVIVCVLNEEPTIAVLLESLLSQTKKAAEIIIVDGGSDDKTLDIIKRYQQTVSGIRLIQLQTTRSEARNIGIRMAKNEIIATTDAGCIAERHWLKRITRPFKDDSVDMVAGFYEMIGDSSFRKALSVFIGITPSKFDDHFLASARSLAFRKNLWEKVGGFPEGLKDTAEDTLFNLKIIESGARIIRVKKALVYWKLPESFAEGIKKIFLYAKGDAKSGIWWHPVKRFSTHNIKISLIYIRYIAGIYLIILCLMNEILVFPVVLALVAYTFWAFKKVYTETQDFIAGLWGVILQYASDIAVMAGFLAGIFDKGK